VGDHHEVLIGMTRAARSMATLTDQVAQDLAPEDDTPGRIDERERVRLQSLAEDLAVQLQRVQDQLRSMEGR
jgi:TolA-binding protein